MAEISNTDLGPEHVFLNIGFEERVSGGGSLRPVYFPPKYLDSSLYNWPAFGQRWLVYMCVQENIFGERDILGI